jgi:hypothetical protein
MHHTTTQRMLTTTLPCLLCFLVLLQAVYPQMARAEFEKPPTLQAQSLLKPELLKGKYYKIDDTVHNNGLFNQYSVTSQFGPFKAPSTSSLHILIREIEAIGAMKKVETDDTAVESLKQSGANTATGIKNLFTDPKGTFEGAATGVSSLFTRVKGTVGKRDTTEAEDNKFKQFIGLSKSKGRIATQFGVSMYSRNMVLQEELERLAMADYLGGLGIGVATSFVPGVGGLILTTSGTARLLNEAINTTPASELWLQNKNKLTAMGFDEDMVALFLNNPVFNPALTTVLTAALGQLEGVDNRDIFLMISLQANNTDMAKTITEVAVMSAGYHKQIAPLQDFTTMARLACAIKKDGSVVALLPADFIIWSSQAATVMASLDSKTKAVKGKKGEIWIFGDFSKQAEAEIHGRGWELHPKSYRKLVPKD